MAPVEPTDDELGEEILKRRRAREHFVDYVEYISGMPAPAHSRLLCSYLDMTIERKIKRLIVCMPPGAAKALALNTPIATPSGGTTMGQLRVGDYVFDEKGEPTRVKWVSPIWRDRPVYEVVTSDGERIIADKDHEWLVRLCRKRPVSKLKTTKWLADRCSSRSGIEDRKPAIKAAAAINLPHRPLIIDPYVFGIWLGDGCKTNGVITTADQFIVDQLKAREGNVRVCSSPGQNGKAKTYRIGPNLRNDGVTWADTFINRLRRLGVWKNKHIPNEYFFASKSQRLLLLQGLIDSDGTVSPRGQVDFCNTNKVLADQVRELVFSLGIKASINSTPAMLNGIRHGTAYKVCFYMSEASLMPRKRNRCRDAEKYTNRYMSVTPAGYADTVCIEVDSPSHLFLCGRSLLPTHNSFYISRHFGAYYLSKFPEHSIIAATHTDDFANTWGRRVRNVIASQKHQILFPGMNISEDSRAAGRWETDKGGEYNAAGVGGNITGRRSNLALIDDPISGIADAESQAKRDDLWAWYGADFYSRLKKDGVIILVQTRWHLDDLAGRLISAQQNGGEKWTIINLPAIAKEKDPLGRKVGEALWPEEYPIERLLTIKKQPSMTPRMWESLYQQSPVLEAGNIIKRSWFRVWGQKDPPKCKYVVQSWDTAVSKKDDAAYSACTTWGVFEEPDSGLPSMILLSAFRRRMNYPELRKMAQRLAYDYLDDNYEFPSQSKKKRAPDIILVEDMSSGSQLIPDLGKAGILATPVRPKMYGDKNARVHLASDLMENGRVWVPGQPPGFTMARRWAEEFIIACISYPAANSRDYVDTLSQAIIRVKKSGWVTNSEDWKEEKPWRVGARATAMYG